MRYAPPFDQISKVSTETQLLVDIPIRSFPTNLINQKSTDHKHPKFNHWLLIGRRRQKRRRSIRQISTYHIIVRNCHVADNVRRPQSMMGGKNSFDHTSVIPSPATRSHTHFLYVSSFEEDTFPNQFCRWNHQQNAKKHLTILNRHLINTYLILDPSCPDLPRQYPQLTDQEIKSGKKPARITPQQQNTTANFLNSYVEYECQDVDYVMRGRSPPYFICGVDGWIPSPNETQFYCQGTMLVFGML